MTYPQRPYADLTRPCFKTMTRDQEAKAFEAYLAGDERALERIVLANVKFAAALARKYEASGLPLEDLTSAAVAGLLKAAPRFNPAKGHKFISYAVWWCRQQVLTFIAEQSRTVTLNTAVLTFSNKMTQLRARLEQEAGHAVRFEVVGEALKGADRSFYADQFERTSTLDYLQQSLRLDAARDEFGHEGYDLPDESPRADDTMAGMDRRFLRDLMEGLNDDQRQVVREYYGLDTGNESTLEEIAVRMGLTRERVRQIKEKALTRMQHKAYAIDMAARRRTKTSMAKV